MPKSSASSSCRVAVIWIDWYAYHVARFRGLEQTPSLSGRVVGIELVGGIGVHAGLKFREELPSDLSIETLAPNLSWQSASKSDLARQVWVRLSDLDPEVVLVPGYYTLPAIAAALWARMHGRASVLMTESTVSDHQRSWWKEALKAAGIRLLFNWAVSGGKAHVEYLRLLHFPAQRIVSSYDVVDNEMFSQGVAALRQQASVPAGLPSRYFLYVGRLAAEKNVSLLVKSWLAYRKGGGTWSLVLVGDGPELASLRELATASAYQDDVYFPGLKSSQELLPFYAFAFCFVLPSTREPWGLVVNEAMASGLPVLISDRCGCAPDLVESGLNGYLFNPVDGVALTELLASIERMPEEGLRRMGYASVEIIQNYSPERFGRSIASIADSVRGHAVLGAATGETP